MSQPPGVHTFDPAEVALIARLAREWAKPICILDLETTGLLYPNAPPCGIVEFGFLLVKPDGETRVGGSLIQPEMAIPWQATRIHGLTNRDVINAPTFATMTQNVVRIFEQSVVVGFNSREFDLPVMVANLARYGCHHPGPQYHLDVRDVWRERHGERGKLADVAAHFGVEPGTAHRSMGDVLTTARILDAMLYTYGAEAVSAHRRDALAHDPEAKASASTEEAPSEPVTDKTPSPASVASGKPAIRAAILEHIAAIGIVRPSDFQQLADQCRVRASTISFELSDMVETGQVTDAQVADPQVQAIIASFLDRAVSEAGDDRLKPLKEALERISETEIDYVQLRVALRRREDAPRPRAEPNRGFRP